MESFILIILLIIPGVWSGNWKVTYRDGCALKGTSVVIRCKYDYPFAHIVTRVSWSKDVNVSGQVSKVLLSQLPSPPNHFKYVGDYWSDCSLEIKDVQLSDQGAYSFSFGTTLDRWRSKTSAHLSVRELTIVDQPSTVTEGDHVSLTCASGCLTPVNVIWFRDGQPVPNAVFQAGREDAGRYHCAILGQETVRSASVALSVQYAPVEVTLSMSPSVVKGSSVTFTCGSDANPPVAQSGYSLHKDGHFISSGQNHTVPEVQPSHSGLYSCQAWNNISRRGIDLISSNEVQLDVQYGPENISISIEPPHAVEGSRVNLTCSSAANPAADNYTWYKSTVSRSSSMFQVGSGQVLSLPSVEASHTGLYLCQARNPLGGNNSTQLLLAIKEKHRGGRSLPILAVIGVSAFVTLVFALLFWLKQRTCAEEKTMFDFTLRRRGLNFSASEDPSNSVYTVRGLPPSTSPANTSCEGEVTYSTVTITPRNPSLPRHTHNSWSNAREVEDSVIYSQPAKSS